MRVEDLVNHRQTLSKSAFLPFISFTRRTSPHQQQTIMYSPKNVGKSVRIQVQRAYMYMYGRQPATTEVETGGRGAGSSFV